MRELKVALVFLTRLPVRLPGTVSLRDLAAAVHLFPAVGALVGLVGATALVGADALGLPPLAAGLLAVAASAAVTGALHEDGLADTADALGAGGDRARALEIMRDSRIGTFGALALVVATVGRAAAAAALLDAGGAGLAAGGLVTAGALSRAAMPVVMRVQPSARAGGLAAGAGRPPAAKVGAGLALAAAVALLLLPAAPCAAAAAAGAVAAAGLARLTGRRFGGCTGDTLGAVQQAAELAFLLGLAAAS